MLYHHHQEPMIRIGVRTVILNLLKVNDPPTLGFVVHEKFYFVSLVDYVASLVVSLCASMDSKRRDDAQEQLDSFVEYLEYLNEIFSLGIENASRPLAAAFTERVVVATLIQGLFRSAESKACRALNDPLRQMGR
nr:Protein CL16A [Polyrhizophydium stewartii]